ncbi:hypothetical protein T4B_10952 [Trichinella pseudospiralis]|uniref:Uncharacterized protein n=1 Tax=Trichinella pseudospiralis TaxID=6337 RepID=A0A0V1GI22_TRIPS|nr:hypothetical protein T4B_10952 [Trichinella pseudospiralis]
MSTFEKPMKLFLENFEFFENGEKFQRKLPSSWGINGL